MAYDVNTGIPLISKIYEGASADKVSVKDFLDQVEMQDMLFIVDRGFYSKKTSVFSVATVTNTSSRSARTLTHANVPYTA